MTYPNHRIWPFTPMGTAIIIGVGAPAIYVAVIGFFEAAAFVGRLAMAVLK